MWFLARCLRLAMSCPTSFHKDQHSWSCFFCYLEFPLFLSKFRCSYFPSNIVHHHSRRIFFSGLTHMPLFWVLHELNERCGLQYVYCWIATQNREEVFSGFLTIGCLIGCLIFLPSVNLGYLFTDVSPTGNQPWLEIPERLVERHAFQI
jgi:hypothetical protein